MLMKNRALRLFSLFSVLMLCISLGAKSLVFFSPQDHPTTKLITLINEAKYKIHAAVYMITDKNIANALIKAKKERGVDVQIITDKITMESNYGKGKLLQENGVTIKAFNASTTQKPQNDTAYAFKFDPIMHHKFALIDNTLWTGSFNWTRSANQKNQENVIVTDEKEIYEKYQTQFEQLKAQCSLELTEQLKHTFTPKALKEFCKKILRVIKRTLE